MKLPESVTRAVPAPTARAWESLAPVLPRTLYLAGGTALAVHLGHRLSNDLDLFYHENAIDLRALRRKIEQLGPFAVLTQEPGALNGIFLDTKLQVLHADQVRRQERLEPVTVVGDIAIAGLGDILAMKLKVVADRGELRDYYDLMAIEQQTARTADEGMGLFLQRYRQPREPASLAPIVRALGYLDDIDEDPSLPTSKDEVAAYWRRRQSELIATLARAGMALDL